MAKRTGADNDLLAMALVGYEAAKARIAATIAEIQAKLGHVVGAPAPSVPKKHRMSAAARKRIAAAQRKRWAAVKKSQAQGQSPAQAGPKKRKLSAAGRKAIIEAMRKRWAAHRKADVKKAKTARKASTSAAS